MGDEASYSDDISALWGDDAGIFDAGTVARPERLNGSRPESDDRIAALEAHVHALAKAVETMRGEVLAQVDLGLARSERRLGVVESHLHAAATRPPAADAALEQRLDAVEARLPTLADARAKERLAALERRTALLAESIEAYRREAAREPHVDAVRADLQAAAAEIAAQADDRLTHRFHELAGHLASQLAALDQRIADLGDTVDSHRVQSVMGWELESLRSELIAAVTGQLAEFRADLHAQLNATAQAEEDRRRIEASWQQVMPGF